MGDAWAKKGVRGRRKCKSDEDDGDRSFHNNQTYLH